jgi:hypothetical protein
MVVGGEGDTALGAAVNQWGYLLQEAGDLRRMRRRIQCPPLEPAPMGRYV